MARSRAFYKNKVRVDLVLYFDKDLTTNVQVIELIEEIEALFGIPFDIFIPGFEDAKRAMRLREFSRKGKKWAELQDLVPREKLHGISVGAYHRGDKKKKWLPENIIIAIDLTLKGLWGMPAHFAFTVGEDVVVEQGAKCYRERLLKALDLSRALEPFYGFVNIGDVGLDWDLHYGGSPTNFQTIEDREILRRWTEGGHKLSREKIWRMLWGNYWNKTHVEGLGGLETLKGALAKYTEYYSPEEGRYVREEIPFELITEYDNGDVFFTLTDNPLDWSINHQTDAFYTLDIYYARLCQFVREKGMFI